MPDRAVRDACHAAGPLARCANLSPAQVIATLALASVGLALTHAASRAESHGEALVRANCAACHAIGRQDESRHPEAPPLRDLHERYPLDALEEAFVEGISVGHPDMPEFVATPDQIGAIIDYIETLAR